MGEHNFGDTSDPSWSLPRPYFSLLRDHGTRLSLEHHQHLYRQGETADSVYLLLKGSVKLTSINIDGLETLLRVQHAEGLLGLAAIGEWSVRNTSAVALVDCDLVVLPKCELIRLMERDAKLAIAISQLLLKRLCSFYSRVNVFLANTVEQRIAQVLLELYEPVEGQENAATDSVKLSHEELSHIVSARRQTVTMILNRFAKAGYITIIRRRIYIEDAAALRLLVPGLKAIV
jgi:CRP/FNR family cyclic AMP-dependent transcriptional regulator